MNAASRRMHLLKIAVAWGITACERTLRKAFKMEDYSRTVAHRQAYLDEREREL